MRVEKPHTNTCGFEDTRIEYSESGHIGRWSKVEKGLQANAANVHLVGDLALLKVIFWSSFSYDLCATSLPGGS